MALSRARASLMSLLHGKVDLAVFLVLGLVNVNMNDGSLLAKLVHLCR